MEDRAWCKVSRKKKEVLLLVKPMGTERHRQKRGKAGRRDLLSRKEITRGGDKSAKADTTLTKTKQRNNGFNLSTRDRKGPGEAGRAGETKKGR